MELKIGLSYVEEVLARIKGDKDEATAQKNYRLANAAVKGQISSLEGKIVKSEIELEKAEEALLDAMYPKEIISGSAAFIKSIADCQDRVTEAKTTLEEIEESLKYFQNLHEKFNPVKK